MAAKARAVSSRGATPDEPPNQRKRLVLPDPKKVVKPSEERVTALSKALDQYREVIMPPAEIVTKAKAELKLVDAAVPASASSPSSQDDRHRLDLWLKQREVPGETSLVRTDGVRKIKLTNGETIEVEKRVDPIDLDISPSRLRPSVYHYHYRAGKLVRVWCDAHPYNVGPDGVGTPSGSACWIGETQADNPEAWRKARQTALDRTAASQRRRSKRNETQDTVNLNAAQFNRLLAPIPTLLQMVNNPSESFGVPIIYPKGEARRVYGLQTAQHARLSRWWERAVERTEGGAPGKDDEQNPFLNGTMKLSGLTGGQWWRMHHGLDKPSVKAEVQVPWIEPPKVEAKREVQAPRHIEPLPKTMAGGYFGLRREYVREVDAETVPINPEPKPAPEKDKVKGKQARLDKPHKLTRRQQRKLRREQRMQEREENKADVPVTVKVVSPEPVAVAGGKKESEPRVVIAGLLPAPAPQPQREPASKPVDIPKPALVGSKGPMLQLFLESMPVEWGVEEGFEKWDGRVNREQLQAVLGYLKESKPLPKLGTPVISMPVPVVANDDDKPFDSLNYDDPDYDEKIARQINEEQEWIRELSDFFNERKARLRQLEWDKAIRDQTYAKDWADRQAATSKVLRMVGEDAREERGQEVVAQLLPRPKMAKRMTWDDLNPLGYNVVEDPRVIKENMRSKWKRLMDIQRMYYEKPHQRDCRVTEVWVGKATGWTSPDRNGWSLSAAVFPDFKVTYVKSPTTKQVVHFWGTSQEVVVGGNTEVLTPVVKEAVLHRRKRLRRTLTGTSNLRTQHFRSVVNGIQLSPFVKWAAAVGDVNQGFHHRKTKKQLVVDSGMRQHWIYADLKAEDYGPLNRRETYRPVIRHQSATDRRVLKEVSMLDQILLGIRDYFKDQPLPKPVVGRKQAQTELKLKLQEQRANPYKYPRYLQYRPSKGMTAWLRRATGDESTSLEHWFEDKPKVETHGTRTWNVKRILPRPVPREPAVVEVTTVPAQSQRPFVVTPDSTFAGIIADHTRALREAGIQISPDDLKKMGISGEKAKPPEYVIVDDVLYERAKQPVRR